MSDDKPSAGSILFSLFGFLIAGGAGGWVLGYKTADRDWKLEAVEAGHGEFVADKNGHVLFRFKSHGDK
jgi:hypothetical protein